MKIVLVILVVGLFIVGCSPNVTIPEQREVSMDVEKAPQVPDNVLLWITRPEKSEGWYVNTFLGDVIHCRTREQVLNEVDHFISPS